MQSALIVHSRHTKKYAKTISRKYKDVTFLEVKKPPTDKVLNIKNDKDIVIGIGGGSVIDTAKIISKNKRCIAIPTTSAGASMTEYATVWATEKISISTKKPIMRMDYNMPKNLPFSVMQSTVFDALSHAIESFWSKKATTQSKRYSKKAIFLINKHYLRKNNNCLSQKDMNMLIIAGNIAGKAIAITLTNVVHAISYSLTIEYGIEHGTACGMLLPFVVEYMNLKSLSELFNLKTNSDIVRLLRNKFVSPKISNFNPNLISEKVIKYKKINDGHKKINKRSLVIILSSIKGGKS